MDRDEKLQIVRSAVKTYKHFPKQGIIYKDIFGVFQNVAAMRALKDLLVEHASSLNIDVIVGLDSRGFLVGPLIAVELGKPFVPIRKKGKLPGDVAEKTFSLEYGEATFEVQTESISKDNRVLIVDDLLATGGSMAAAIELVKSLEGEVVECLIIMELVYLGGRSKLQAPVYSLIEYD
ncbi:adenine phosphoribosyltransferase [Fopius arisanus]|uniref:Adenine phosphoribosyltransferase n=1 Tax=Fopius arisanus TaxID=64838 RepID=A0A9R1U318_9HYME|nr:PREDICTED: adenine phosphoribosyltransferase [Fopius arisanus]